MKEIYDIPESVAARAHIGTDAYARMYQRSIDDPEGFWAEQAELFVDWFKPWERVLEWDYHRGHVRWFDGAQLNVAYNCLDRHLEARGDQTAIIWEGDDPEDGRHLSYRELHLAVCRFANALKALGVCKGDRVCIYMPMIPEAVTAMLACARIGAVHSVVFGGFSPEALRNRILDADCRVLITADEGVRGAKVIPLKENADKALEECPDVSRVVVVRRTGGDVAWNERDVWYHDIVADASGDCPPEPMASEDPLFILYTSGSTGKPKGVLHTTGGYLLYAAITHKYSFDLHDGDIYWCTADVGWVTGHTYIVYGPLANGATTLMFEGLPTYPDASRFWQVVDKHHVNTFYTAPTAIRALMRLGDGPVKKTTSRASLRILGTVGEPINPEAWRWYHDVVGDGRCPVVDTWWQTETGGHLITPLPGATALKPGSASRPFFGIRPAIVNRQGEELEGECEGNLVITHPWPGQMRTVYGDHQRFIDTYFAEYPGKYFTGDGCRRDKDGYYWITGRVDDVLNVSGHRLGTAEIESALVLHESVAEAAVVGCPHEVKGEAIYAYVTLVQGVEGSEALQLELNDMARNRIGAFVKLDAVQWALDLPKTRSGKIMRRILRKIAKDETDDLGDISTLADSSVVDDLIARRKHIG